MKEIELFTDGSCSGNPGPGGYGAILRYNGRERELSGGDTNTTNNRMELTAVIVGLSALKEPCRVTLTTDSQYVVNALTKGWLESWKQRGYVKADKKPVLNRDLWEQLDALLQVHKVTCVWVRGHEGHPENERCDRLAVAETEKHK